MKHYQTFVLLVTIINFGKAINTIATIGGHTKHFNTSDPKLVAILESARLQIWARDRAYFPAIIKHIWNITLVVRKTNSHNIFGYWAQIAAQTSQQSPVRLVNCSIWVQPTNIAQSVNQLKELICQ